MILTVLWEDQRAVEVRNFGPHVLLLKCVEDRRPAVSYAELKRRVVAVPKKGNGRLINSLETELALFAGPVCAVLDRDRIRECWAPGQKPADCRTAICSAIWAKAPGGYEIVLLEQNVETLLDACHAVLRRAAPAGKPSPNERDRVLLMAAWQDRSIRDAICTAVPSFARVVDWVERSLPP